VGNTAQSRPARSAPGLCQAAATALRQCGFAGPIVSHVLSQAHLERLQQAGATQTYLTMENAGRSLANQAVEALAPETA
jgi:hypothetical protein